MADVRSAKQSMIKRLSGRFFVVHTQKHTQEYLLDFNSRVVQHYCRLIAVCGLTVFSDHGDE
jgi:hypothetical protein